MKKLYERRHREDKRERLSDKRESGRMHGVWQKCQRCLPSLGWESDSDPLLFAPLSYFLWTQFSDCRNDITSFGKYSSIWYRIIRGKREDDYLRNEIMNILKSKDLRGIFTMSDDDFRLENDTVKSCPAQLMFISLSKKHRKGYREKTGYRQKV